MVVGGVVLNQVSHGAGLLFDDDGGILRFQDPAGFGACRVIVA